jgi:hypothetical protein
MDVSSLSNDESLMFQCLLSVNSEFNSSSIKSRKVLIGRSGVTLNVIEIILLIIDLFNIKVSLISRTQYSIYLNNIIFHLKEMQNLDCANIKREIFESKILQTQKYPTHMNVVYKIESRDTYLIIIKTENNCYRWNFEIGDGRFWFRNKGFRKAYYDNGGELIWGNDIVFKIIYVIHKHFKCWNQFIGNTNKVYRTIKLIDSYYHYMLITIGDFIEMQENIVQTRGNLYNFSKKELRMMGWFKDLP